MFTRNCRRGFTLIELLVVISIILLLAGLLLTGVNAARRYVQRSAVRMEIQHLMTALVAYNDEFNDYPPGGLDSKPENGNLDDDGDNMGCGTKNASEDDATELQLRAVTVRLAKDGGNSYVGPYYSPREHRINDDGQFVDRFGSPYRYLADGRRTDRDPETGLRMPSRVQGRKPVVWSVAEDLKQDLENDNEDDPDSPNGKVDEMAELPNDICSWFD